MYYSDVDKFKIGTYNGTDETTKVALSKLPFIKSVDDIKLVDQQHSHEYKYVSNALFTGDAANYTTYTSEISNHKLVLNKTVTTTITPSGEISLNVQSKSTSIEGSNVSLEENK